MPGKDSESTSLSIVCFIHSLSGGGAERVMAGLSSSLAGRGHRVTLVTFDDAKNDRHRVDEAVTRVSLDLPTGAKGILSRARQVRARHLAISQTVGSLSPDVVLSFCDRTNVDVLWAANRISQSPPIVVCERSDPAQQSIGWFWNSMRRCVYRNAAAIVVLTDAAARHFRSGSFAITIIPSGVKSSDRMSVRESAASSKTIVGAGRLEQEKGFDRLLDAFSIATEDTPQWRLVIYGEGSCREALLKQARSLGIADRVEFPGWVRPLDAPMSEATLFCLPSRYEGFPSVLLEAMSMGVPVVSVDCESGPRAIIEHGRNGLLVEPSTDGLAEGLRRMMVDPDLRERLGKAGVEVVHRFGWDTMVDRYEQLLRDVVGGSEPSKRRTSP